MMFSSATEYAMRGLSELVARGIKDRVLLDDLVAGTDIPRDFLAKIFQRLAKGGVLVSAKGRGGGFALARPAHQITLIDVISAIEGPEALDRCAAGLSTCNDEVACPLHDLFKPIRQRLKDYFTTTTLADLGASLRAKPCWQKRRAEQAAGLTTVLTVNGSAGNGAVAVAATE